MAEAEKDTSFTKGCFVKFVNILEPQPSLSPHMEESGKENISTFNNEKQGEHF